MKFVLSYLLLFVYASMLIKPVLPFIADIAQHIFNYKEHITRVHFENGTYHVHNELKENAKKQNTPGEASNAKKYNSQTEYVFNEVLKTRLVVYYLHPKYTDHSSILLSTELSTDYPPPKV